MILKNTEPICRGKSLQLVVVLHGWLASGVDLANVRDTIAEAMPDADLLIPDYPAGLFSGADPIEITEELINAIADAVGSCNKNYNEIILIGHSLGALLVRKAFAFERGEAQDRDESNPLVRKRNSKNWADKVSRIILLAGTNRGWEVKNQPRHIAWQTWLLFRVSHQFWRWFRVGKLISSAHRGAPFIANLRIQWINLANRTGTKLPLTIQLLGDRDDVVTEEDNVDVQSGAGFIYKAVRGTGHSDVIQFTGRYREERKRVFLEALLTPLEELESDFIAPLEQKEEVEKFVFVMHGIRDYGNWTDELGEYVVGAAKALGVDAAYKASSYGYFPMMGFLLQPERQDNVRWFMDEYTEALAKYPNASMNFIGHSNGTYLLASALERYAACKFDKVVFFGSVVPRNYQWGKMVNGKRLTRIQNYVATKDAVVAIFPAVFELFPHPDLGSAGHNGFIDDEAKRNEIRYVIGGHGAVLNSRNRATTKKAIARFILGNDSVFTIRDELEKAKCLGEPSGLVQLASKLCVVIWLVLIAIVVTPVILPTTLWWIGLWSTKWWLAWWCIPVLWPPLAYLILRRI